MIKFALLYVSYMVDNILMGNKYRSFIEKKVFRILIINQIFRN